MRENALKATWRQGGSTAIGWLSIPSSFSAEVMAHQGFDGLCIDMQHGVIDYDNLVPMLQAISQTSTVPLVRVPWNDPAILMKALDAGAYGVIVPLVNTREDAERAVGACRYPPDGYRSFGPIRAAWYGGRDYHEGANKEIAVLAMIETRQGIDNLDEICATPGLDGVYIGPADLSYALGLPPRMDSDVPVHVETVAKILETTRRHGIICGIHCGGPDFAAARVKEGMQLVTIVADAGAIAQAAGQALRTFRQAMG